MMTRLILATQPWSQDTMVDVVICAIPRATASPLVVMMTTCMTSREMSQCMTKQVCSYEHQMLRKDQKGLDKMQQQYQGRPIKDTQLEDGPMHVLWFTAAWWGTICTLNGTMNELPSLESTRPTKPLPMGSRKSPCTHAMQDIWSAIPNAHQLCKKRSFLKLLKLQVVLLNLKLIVECFLATLHWDMNLPYQIMCRFRGLVKLLLQEYLMVACLSANGFGTRQLVTWEGKVWADLVIDFNAILKAEQSRDHELGTVAYGIDGWVLEHQALVVGQNCLQWHDHPPQVFLITQIVCCPLCIQNVMTRHHVVPLTHDAWSDSSQLLWTILLSNVYEMLQGYAMLSQLRQCRFWVYLPPCFWTSTIQH